MCKCENVQMIECLNNSASKGDHLHICTFSHLHINQAFSHSPNGRAFCLLFTDFSSVLLPV
nr:MAG TPA_asm: hypothetical protein [Caudoviricetes sp.]